MIKDLVLLSALDGYDNETIADLIDRHIIGRNAERNRKILKRRLIDGLYYDPLAEEFGLSVRQTKTLFIEE